MSGSVRHLLVLAPVLLGLAACTGNTGPTREEAAAYFGLADGRTLTYDVSGGTTATTSSITMRSTSSFAERLAFQQEERNMGNVIVETMAVGAEVETMILLRAGDCLPDCRDYLTPPVLLRKPIEANSSYETESDVSVVSAAGRNPGPRERHSLTVGPEVNVPTGAGAFRAHLVSWRIFTDGVTGSVDRQFYFSPERGIVQIQKDALTYTLKSGVSP